MATQKQIEANRRNAQKSTGPRTLAGKALSAKNALKTGIDSDAQIFPFEDPAELEQLAAEYYLQHKPKTPEVRACLDRLIRAEWLQRRLSRIEPLLLQQKLDGVADSAPGDAAAAYEALGSTLQRLQVRINAAERNYRNALQDLAEVNDSFARTSDELASFLETRDHADFLEAIAPQMALVPTLATLELPADAVRNLNRSV